MNDREKKIQEQRTIEAVRKSMMGFSGKLGTVVRYLGEPIVMQNEGGLYQDATYLDDPWDLPTPESDELGGTSEEVQSQIPYMSSGMETGEPQSDGWRQTRPAFMPEVSITQIGWHFDGLSRGMHIEIKYDGDSKELVAYYKGYLVYKETAGELAAYTPHDEWESLVDRLYPVAREKEKQHRKQEKQEKIELAGKIKDRWLDKMKRKWGL